MQPLAAPGPPQGGIALSGASEDAQRRTWGSDTPRRSLGTRLVLATLVFCLLFTLVTISVLTYSAWNSGLSKMNAELAQLEQVYQGTLSKAIWELDRESLQTHVLSATRVPAVGKIVLKVTLASRAAEVLEGSSNGWSGAGRAPTRRLTLTYEPYPGARESVGELTLYGDERVLWQRLRGELTTIAITQLLQSLMLAALIMLMFNRIVTVHIQRIAAHLARLSPNNLGLTLGLHRRAGHQDELTLLVSGINQLQGSLATYLEQQQRYEHELAGHRDRLAQLVEERTIELQAANSRLQNLARTDQLTGLANRRHFDEAKEEELRRALRSGQDLSLLICDIDFFKDYNDHYGHAMGDQCLCAVAHTMRASLARAGDMVARIGGEEFAVLLPATNEVTARMLALRVHQAVIDRGIVHQHSKAAGVVTISIGVAVLAAGDADDFDALFARADQALYRAKARGRNQVAGPISGDQDDAPGEKR
ncbi:diguanylate cyclase domain-containing protein [Rhodoferax sp.]|uniref:diguanylate cyclase domain-containing protein n=1 Tax=Rhodoferax sp. TaxID=50421 RepID=UPI00275373C6|nr:GGDEF domain-containing protein [Rhodoferax sp.]